MRGPSFDFELSQHHTPASLATRMAGRVPALFMGRRVLEPSAGGGALVDAALAAGAAEVVAVEFDDRWVRFLRRKYARESRVRVVRGDFVRLARELRGHIDASISNVPYDDGADTEHLAALVDVDCDHCSLLNASALSGVKRFERVWSRVMILGEAKLVRRPKFSGAKGTGEHDMSVVWWTTRPTLGAQPFVEHWPEHWK